MAAGGKNSPRVATTEENKRKALELRRSGKSYQQIADVLEVDKAYAFRLVNDALAECVAERKEDARHVVELELQRLDEMIASLWGVAIAELPDDVDGEIASALFDKQLATIDRVTRLMERRAKLLGLDAATRTELSGPNGGPITTDALQARAAALMAKAAGVADAAADRETESE